jgi:hypothetical protein
MCRALRGCVGCVVEVRAGLHSTMTNGRARRLLPDGRNQTGSGKLKAEIHQTTTTTTTTTIKRPPIVPARHSSSPPISAFLCTATACHRLVRDNAAPQLQQPSARPFTTPYVCPRIPTVTSLAPRAASLTRPQYTTQFHSTSQPSLSCAHHRPRSPPRNHRADMDTASRAEACRHSRAHIICIPRLVASLTTPPLSWAFRWERAL